MYEHRNHHLLSRRAFALRVARHLSFALLIVVLALGSGIAGYHFIAGLPWIDALLNASMILGGMGPVDALSSAPAKIFASAYALFSGLAFIGIASILIAPFAHRILHALHAEADESLPFSSKGRRAARSICSMREPDLRCDRRRTAVF